ncbi:MAG TPA: aldo/keto reductase [Drouetiella sp.]
MPLVTYNQIQVPSMMYGTAWKKDATAKLVEEAVDTGFRAIDTANQLIHYYEEGVGHALQALARRGITREQLFLQTKFTSVNGQDNRTPYDANADVTTQVKQSFDSSLKHLHTDHLDSYVLHGPYTRRGLVSEDWEVWTEMEAQFLAGKTRMIGVSNVNAYQLSELCAKAKTKPMMVQNRCYASAGWDMEVRQICQDNDIIYQGFSLLTANPQVLNDPAVRAMAKKYSTGPAQIVFRFSMQVGMLPLTGTTSAKHMKENLACESFTLEPSEVRQIELISVGANR